MLTLGRDLFSESPCRGCCSGQPRRLCLCRGARSLEPPLAGNGEATDELRSGERFFRQARQAARCPKGGAPVAASLVILRCDRVGSSTSVRSRGNTSAPCTMSLFAGFVRCREASAPVGVRLAHHRLSFYSLGPRRRADKPVSDPRGHAPCPSQPE